MPHVLGSCVLPGLFSPRFRMPRVLPVRLPVASPRVCTYAFFFHHVTFTWFTGPSRIPFFVVTLCSALYSSFTTALRFFCVAVPVWFLSCVTITPPFLRFFYTLPHAGYMVVLCRSLDVLVLYAGYRSFYSAVVLLRTFAAFAFRRFGMPACACICLPPPHRISRGGSVAVMLQLVLHRRCHAAACGSVLPALSLWFYLPARCSHFYCRFNTCHCRFTYRRYTFASLLPVGSRCLLRPCTITVPLPAFAYRHRAALFPARALYTEFSLLATSSPLGSPFPRNRNVLYRCRSVRCSSFITRLVGVICRPMVLLFAIILFEDDCYRTGRTFPLRDCLFSLRSLSLTTAVLAAFTIVQHPSSLLF